MFRWLSRKGGVQAGYTRRVIDLRHSKILGSNRWTCLFFSRYYRYHRSHGLSRQSFSSSACVVASAGSFRCLPSVLLRSASVPNSRYLVSNFQHGYARVKTGSVRPIRVRYETSDRDHGRVRNVRDFWHSTEMGESVLTKRAHAAY